ncbi:histidine kinase N-terminal 7TM domain-containing diguanylate cyclase [Alkalibacterium sp. AK22]|uniref:histidine kinase N-terminal 7TM domain-containing diguanylate cyclase n=1 Tax=Alkalibacterium sp. AK22 TaxID=1229520 RepID=UPI0009DC9F1C|nr:histidine kinase N-terminal 7TM domain-containing protein [Alkalibacterium sp. AK22]
MMIHMLSAYLFFAVLMTLFFCSYVMMRSNISYMKYFFWFCLGLSIYLLGYMMELHSIELADMIFWNQIQYIAIPFIPTLWLLVSTSYLQRDRYLNRTQLIVLLLVPVLTALIRLTNTWHQLFYSSMEIMAYPAGRFLSLGKGPWYYIHTLHSSLVTGLILTLLIKDFKKGHKENNRRNLLLLIALVVPYAGMTMILSGTWISALDYTALVLPLSLILIMISIYTYDFLEVKSLARARIFEEGADAMLVLDLSNNVLDYNLQAVSLFQKLDIDLTGSSLKNLLLKRASLQEKIASNVVETFMTPDQRIYEIMTWPMNNRNERPLAYIKIISDITERKKMMLQLQQMARIDELSQLYNRRYFMELFEESYKLSEEKSEPLILLMLDLDRFKLINDTWGHGGGDLVIRKFSRLLKEHFPEAPIGRLGGEEFAVLLNKSLTVETFNTVEQFRIAFENQTLFYNELPIRATTSIGICEKTDAVSSPGAMLLDADKKLYKAKLEGRNQVVC